MDFKSILNKLASMDTPITSVKAPTLPTSVQLNEDAQLRVLSGQTSIVAETKKKADDEKKEKTVKEEMSVGDSKKTAKGGTVTKTKTGIVHKAAPGNYGGTDDDDTDLDDDDKPKAKKAKKESIEEASEAQTAARAKFMAMVKGKKGDKKDDKKADKTADKKDDKKAAPKKGENPFAKKKTVKESDQLAEPPKVVKISKDLVKQGYGKQPKKKTVKESVERKLTFKEMIKLVQESGGQQQIDPVDSELFAWAQRVAKSKFQESVKQDAYAGVVYERMGGAFEMYDVLAEDKK